MFLLDDFVMTTKQRTNLKFLLCLEKIPSEALCMLQQVYKEQTLTRSTVFLWHKRFREGREDVENNPKCGTILASSLHKFCAFSRSSVIVYQMLFRFNPSSSEISRTVNRRSPRTIFTSSTLISFLLVEGLPHPGSSSTSSRPSLNFLCQRNTVERVKVCSL